jgi:catechol 2,3-dioxygenase-like lactoylglutathione lyase family enzyme
MPEDVRFESVSPVVPVRDLDAAMDRYRRLGFDVHGSEGPARYAFADRCGVSIHLNESVEHDPERADSVVYLYVSDADRVHAEWHAARVQGGLGEPRDRQYGLREFGYVDPDGTLLRVGSPLADPRGAE